MPEKVHRTTWLLLGNSALVTLPTWLYFPALVLLQRCLQAHRHFVSVYWQQASAKQVLGALMHKPIRAIYGVLKSGKPFAPNQLLPAT
ncbi:hypothetical protein DXZ20_07140 [Leptolyngbyaceae cyanobacterium CCMR0081]|uniref:Uncharacterized protein n=1 Tax=Adonisia turfae CCMR0081 TaxID=2292702 RepID=A0A6M0RGZ5_9CYAN|nr:hypothetical protein [Adonisia turfae CCMR0081]